ncbi:hypothetical protein [Levyella massiliensis]|uniref:hypothetical protein n=1 Tax=Levyella massiliensis TaxID=938289 RepID=UPI0024ACEB32|nr:hypothetical protein [Levyella massiliensis]
MSIENVIRTWDPYSLFPYAPIDEYNNEIEDIKALVADGCSRELLLDRLPQIFVISDINEGKRDLSSVVDSILNN